MTKDLRKGRVLNDSAIDAAIATDAALRDTPELSIADQENTSSLTEAAGNVTQPTQQQPAPSEKPKASNESATQEKPAAEGNAIPPVKSVDDIFKDLIGLKGSEVQKAKAEQLEEINKEALLDRTRQLEKQLHDTQTAQIVSTTLSQVPEDQAGIISKGMAEVMKVPKFKDMLKDVNIPPAERAGLWLTLARGIASGELLASTEKLKKEAARQNFEEVVSGNSGTQAGNRDDDENTQLKKRAAAGDKNARLKLQDKALPSGISALEKILGDI